MEQEDLEEIDNIVYEETPVNQAQILKIVPSPPTFKQSVQVTKIECPSGDTNNKDSIECPIEGRVCHSASNSVASATNSTASGTSVNVSSCTPLEGNRIDFNDFFCKSKKGISSDNVEMWPPDRLYCRDDEINLMEETYRRVIEQQKSHVILIRGESGAGKTTMARSLKDYHYQQYKQQHHQNQNGSISYLEGRFDLLERPQSYRPFVAAVTDFVQQLDEKERLIIRQNIERTITDQDDIDAIAQIIPELKYLLSNVNECKYEQKEEAVPSEHNTTPDVDNDDDEQSTPDRVIQNRFKHIFHLLLRALSFPCSMNDESNTMIMIFLDDVQWASEIDLNLLYNLVVDVSKPTILFVLGYSETSGASQCMGGNVLGKIKNRIEEINLCNVTENRIAAMLSQQFGLQNDDTVSMAQVISTQTNGNFFFLVQFLQYLQKNGVIIFNICGNNQWSWDMEVMKLMRLEFDSVECLICSTMANLSEQGQEDLKVAVCLGAVLDNVIVQYLSSGNMMSSLDELTQTGILIASSVIGCRRFVHHKIRDVLYLSMKTEERQRYHYRIGRKLWRELDMKNLVRFIFVVVDHLVAARDIMQDSNERIAVAKLCLSAGERAAKQSAFRTARSYFIHGIELLDNEDWHDEYELFLGLYSGAAECSFSSGFVEEVFQYRDEILYHAKCFEDTIRVRIMCINALGSSGKLFEARDAGIEMLKELGEYFPKNPSRFYLFLELGKLKYKLIRDNWVCEGNELQILKFPLMEDPRKLAAMQALNLILLSAIATSREWVCMIGLRMMHLTVDYGICSLSSIGMVLFAHVAW
jgi:predicted ATPase